MDEKIDKIEKEINNNQSYINPFKTKEYIKILLFRIKELEEELKGSRISDEDLQKLYED